MTMRAPKPYDCSRSNTHCSQPQHDRLLVIRKLVQCGLGKAGGEVCDPSYQWKSGKQRNDGVIHREWKDCDNYAGDHLSKQPPDSLNESAFDSHQTVLPPVQRYLLQLQRLTDREYGWMT